MDVARVPRTSDAYAWWQTGVVYHVYPLSFQDSDGDGRGDLRGIRSRLDHLEWLGIDAVWLSPIYPSPMADFGYDVSDYTAVAPTYGTLEDLDALIDELHRRDMRLILDFVPNHTSDQHAWFLASRSSREDPRRGWYLWRDPAPGGGPPNNWRSVFGGSAWEWDEATGQYYYHAFAREQPDLDWSNPAVRAAMSDVLRFWFARGVDGFRIDVLWHLAKDPELRDNPPNPSYVGDPGGYHELEERHSADQAAIHDIVSHLRRVADEYDGRLLIGEIYLPLERLVLYYGGGSDGIHLPYNFQLILVPWTASAIGETIERYESLLPAHGWPNWVLGNHDQPRIASRTGPQQAGVAAMLLLTLRGTPTLYYGDEIGMPDVPVPAESVQDPLGKRIPERGRDPQRGPMRWEPGPGAGFTNGRPWLPMPGLPGIDVASQRGDPRSLLELHRRLLRLRREEPSLAMGAYATLARDGRMLVYRREVPGHDAFAIALNLSGETGRLPPGEAWRGRVAVATHPEREGEPLASDVILAPDEGFVVRLEG